MRRLRSMVVLVVLVAGIALPIPVSGRGPGTASAATAVVDRLANSSDPAAAYAALSPGEKELVRLATTASGPVQSEVTDPIATGGITAALGGCWGRVRSLYQTNVFGTRLWTFNQQLNWCSNGSTISSYTAQKWPSGVSAGWTYTEISGPAPQLRSGGTGRTSVEVWGQGQFQFCLVGACVQSLYPWVDQRGYASGAYGDSWGS
jgi:hypothetical protein